MITVVKEWRQVVRIKMEEDGRQSTPIRPFGLVTCRDLYGHNVLTSVSQESKDWPCPSCTHLASEIRTRGRRRDCILYVVP